MTAGISVDRLTLGFDGHVVQRDVSFVVQRGEIFVLIGGRGCGKSTLLRSMIGLLRPSSGNVFYGGSSFWAVDEEARSEITSNTGHPAASRLVSGHKTDRSSAPASQ